VAGGKQMNVTNEHKADTADWNGVPPNGEGMWHWLRHREGGGLVVAWWDLHDWTINGSTRTKPQVAEVYDYYAPCIPPDTRYPTRSERQAMA
jgi:hypothetical protein